MTQAQQAAPINEATPDIMAVISHSGSIERPAFLASSPSDLNIPDSIPSVTYPTKDRSYFANEIRVRWNKAFDGVLAVGVLIEEAKVTLVKSEYRRFKKDLPFSNSVAQRLRNIAKHERITDPTYRRYMPFAWNTLAAITHLSDDAFQRGIADGIITPNCAWKDIKRLRDQDDNEQALRSHSSIANGLSDENNVAAPGAATAGHRPTRMKQLATIRQKMEAKQNGPHPLVLSVPDHVMTRYHSELAALVEELNGRLPHQYPFISEVRIGGGK